MSNSSNFLFGQIPLLRIFAVWRHRLILSTAFDVVLISSQSRLMNAFLELDRMRQRRRSPRTSTTRVAKGEQFLSAETSRRRTNLESNLATAHCIRARNATNWDRFKVTFLVGGRDCSHLGRTAQGTSPNQTRIGGDLNFRPAV